MEILSKLEFTESGNYIVQSTVEAMELQSIGILFVQSKCTIIPGPFCYYLTASPDSTYLNLNTVCTCYAYMRAQRTSQDRALFLCLNLQPLLAMEFLIVVTVFLLYEVGCLVLTFLNSATFVDNIYMEIMLECSAIEMIAWMPYFVCTDETYSSQCEVFTRLND